MNKAPINGICSLTLNGTDQLRCFHYSLKDLTRYLLLFRTGSGITVKSLVDELEFSCNAWIDPELMGIKSYLLYTKKDDGELNPMLKIANFDPFSPTFIRLGTGRISFVAEITDIWGAKALFTIVENIETIVPTNEERIAFEQSGIKEEILVRFLSWICV
jgi:Ni,Fe-hydrogenase I cytochrome b subunit